MTYIYMVIETDRLTDASTWELLGFYRERDEAQQAAFRARRKPNLASVDVDVVEINLATLDYEWI